MAETLSTLDLDGFIARLRAFLVDAGELSYSDNSLTEGIRQAAGDLGRMVYGAFVTITDLDSAITTSVEQRDEDMVVRGAAGYAGRMRAVDRVDSANMGQNMPSTLLDWSTSLLDAFAASLAQMKIDRTATDIAAEEPPSVGSGIGKWTWDESDKNW